MLQSFQKNIISQITLLLCLFLISFIGLYFGQGLLEKRKSYLQGLLDNEQVKMELSHILQKKLLAVNVNLQNMVTAGSLAEMNYIFISLSELKTELVEILNIIEKGGSKTFKKLNSFDFDGDISRNFTYVNYARQRNNIELLELKAKLTEMDRIFQEFQTVVKQKLSIDEGRDLFQIAGNDSKAGQHYKGIEPFIKQMLESSYHLYSQSLLERERIRIRNNRFSQTYQWIGNSATVVILILILLVGTLVLKSSRKILLERQRYQQELLDNNENLEAIVQKRTIALKKQVADRKTAETKIKDQTDFLRKVIESLSHPFYVIDAQDYSIVLANSAALTQGDGTQTTCYALTHKRDLPCDNVETPCPLQIMKKTGEVVILERTHRDKKGEETFSEVHGYPIFDDNGTLVQMIEYSLDITAKKIAEKSLKQTNEQLEEKVRERTGALEEQILQRKEAQLKLIKSERYFRRLIENVSDIITILDEDGRITYSSPSAEKLMGIPLEKFKGVHIKDMVLAEDLTHVDIPTLYALHSGATPMEYRLKDRAGAVHVMESYIQKFQQDDDSDGYILYSRDITVRKKAEEENHKLQMVVEQSPSSVVITDINGKIEYVNPAFEHITGYSYDEAVGKNPRVLKSGKTPESAFEQLWKTITAGHVWRGEFINKKKNGDYYDENVLVIPIKNLQGEITNFVAVKENITEIKKARKLAENANRAKSNFLSQMSHELRTPLNAINGFSQLMLRSKKNPLNEKQKGMTEQIHTAGHHLLQLINEVLDLAKIESGELSLSIEVVNPQVAITDCISLSQPLAQEKQIRITNHCEGKELSFLRADSTRVKQILLNLLSNAVKYNNPSGTVSIDVKTNIPGFLRFVVEDNGIGIPLDKQKGIFTPFVRAVDNPDDIEGTGIGMTITKQLVEKMGGEIGFESQLGEGSTFWFTLPVSASDSLPYPKNMSVENQEIENVAVAQHHD